MRCLIITGGATGWVLGGCVPFETGRFLHARHWWR
jgi:hypothetical protein